MGRQDFETETLLAVGGFPNPLPFDTTQVTSLANRSNPKPGDPCHPLAAGMHAPAIAFDSKASGRNGFGVGDISPTLRAMGHEDSHGNAGGQVAVAPMYSIMPQNSGRNYKARPVDIAQPLMAGGPVGGNQGGDFLLQQMAVRRLTPRECERLQGFPDDFTLVDHRGKPAADGPRYKALGNSWAVPCARWIAERMLEVDGIPT